ncbi:MAG: ribonuclease PH [Acidobacteriota bacterium]
MRENNRKNDELREISIEEDFITNQPASLLYKQGNTRLVCTAMFNEKVPFFAKNEKKGWISAEYSMLPGSTGKQRFLRERGGRMDKRNIEIQRFVGRSLRNIIDLKKIKDFNVFLDMDIIQADGGTRCASVNSGVIAMMKLLKHLVFENKLYEVPEFKPVAAVSVGIKNGEILADLDFPEDSTIDADINIVSNEKGDIVEVTGFAEESSVPKDLFFKAIDLGLEKNGEIIEILKKYL